MVRTDAHDKNDYDDEDAKVWWENVMSYCHSSLLTSSVLLFKFPFDKKEQFYS